MKKGLVIALIIVGVLLVIGLAYYFLIYKKEQSSKESGTPSGTPSGSTSGGLQVGDAVVVTPCVPYTQAQQDADMQKCAGDCQKKPIFQQASCMMVCNTHKKPIKTC